MASSKNYLEFVLEQLSGLDDVTYRSMMGEYILYLRGKIIGAKAPKLVTDEMVSKMRPGSVIVDVAVDQGGVVETADRVTTHDEPVYEKHGVLHYAVANIPGAVARTSTLALTNVTLPYIEALADKGFEQAIADDLGLQQGVTTYKGYLTSRPVAEGLNRDYTDINDLV